MWEKKVNDEKKSEKDNFFVHLNIRHLFYKDEN